MAKKKQTEEAPFYPAGAPNDPRYAEDGKARVSRMLDQAEPVVIEGVAAPEGARDPLPGDVAKWGYRAGEWRKDGFTDPTGYLPVDCPVRPLGYDGDVYWFLDTRGQVRAVTVGKLNRSMIASLFMTRHNFMFHHWPKVREEKLTKGLAADEAGDALINACGAKGHWNDVEAVRGRGCWRDLSGKLLIHCGDRLMTSAGEEPLGEYDGFVYPDRPPLPGPLDSPVRDDSKHGPGWYLLQLFRQWHWKRPEIDPVLAVGQIGADFLSGALEWRPSSFITGDKATGKSTLQKVFKGVHGGWLVQAADTTSAGIYQRVKHDAVPVAVDELESERDSAKQTAILKLARLSSSGALMLRGGADHKGTEFQARSCFLFSSINHPPLEPQDMSRMAMLALKKIPAEAPKPKIDMQELALIGRACLARLLEEWDRFDDTLTDYQVILGEGGHDGRGQDTFGTLLACADILIGEDAAELGLAMGDADLSPWSTLMAAGNLTEYEGAEENWRLCLSTILQTPIEAWRGGQRQTVGELLDAFLTDKGDDLPFEKVRRELGAAGLSLKRKSQSSRTFHLFVPNQNPALQRLFRDTKWQGEPGAGVWAGALNQAPEEWVTKGIDRISGWQARGVQIPLDKICGELLAELQAEYRGGKQDGQ